MSDDMPDLSQLEADSLMSVKKLFEDKSAITVNRPYKVERKLVSATNVSDIFYLNINETAIEFGKYTVNNRFFSIPLVRICIDTDGVHENPDGKHIKGSHIHIYKEKYGDKFAKTLSECNITGTTTVQILTQFLEFCNIETVEIRSQGQLVG